MTYAVGPARDFYLAAGDFAVVSQTVGATTINSYAPAELGDGAALARDFPDGFRGIGPTAVAAGLSLPVLVVAVFAAVRGRGDLALGVCLLYTSRCV